MAECLLALLDLHCALPDFESDRIGDMPGDTGVFLQCGALTRGGQDEHTL